MHIRINGPATTFLRLAIFVLVFVCEGPSVDAATYYVSSSSGHDGNSGTNSRMAWRSLVRVNAATLGPGDVVLLQRGDEWRETLNPLSSGTAGMPIVIGAYGTGPLPRILGSVSRTGSEQWTQESANIWYTAQVDFVPRMVFHDGVGSPQRATKSEMAVDWEWSYDAGARRLYYRLTENPGRHRIEVVERNGIGWTSAHYIIVRDLQIAYAEIGIGLHGSDGWVINGVSINDVVVDAIHGNGGAQAVQVVNSKIADWNWRGVGSTRGQGDAFKGYGIHVLGDALGVPSDEWTIEGNHLTLLNVPTGEDSTAIAIDMGGHARSIARNIVEARSWSGGGGIMVWRPLGYSSLRIEWNRISTVGGIGILVQDLGATGFVAGVEIAKNVVENPCGQDVFDEEAIRVWSGSNTTVIVADNVVNGVPAGRNRHVGIRVRGSRASVIGNTTLATDVGISVELGSSVEVRSNRSGGHRIAAFAVDSSSQYRASANVFD